MQYIVVQKGDGTGRQIKKIIIIKCFIADADVKFFYHPKKYSINNSSSLSSQLSSPFHEAQKKATHFLRLFYTYLSW